MKEVKSIRARPEDIKLIRDFLDETERTWGYLMKRIAHLIDTWSFWRRQYLLVKDKPIPKDRGGKLAYLKTKESRIIMIIEGNGDIKVEVLSPDIDGDFWKGKDPKAIFREYLLSNPDFLNHLKKKYP